MRAEVESCITCRFSEFGLRMERSETTRRYSYWVGIDCYRFPEWRSVFGDGCGEHEFTANRLEKTKEFEERDIEAREMTEREREEPPCET